MGKDDPVLKPLDDPGLLFWVSRSLPGLAARTRAIAAEGASPSSTSNRAAIMPVRPRPPRQCIRTFSPAFRVRPMPRAVPWPSGLELRVGNVDVSDRQMQPVDAPSRASPRRGVGIFRSPNSRASISVTTVLAFQPSIASRSNVRSRAQPPDIAFAPDLPGG